MANLPKGVKVCIAGKTYRGEIPDKLCPPKFRAKHKTVVDDDKPKTVVDDDKPKTVTDGGKHKGNGGE